MYDQFLPQKVGYQQNIRSMFGLLGFVSLRTFISFIFIICHRQMGCEMSGSVSFMKSLQSFFVQQFTIISSKYIPLPLVAPLDVFGISGFSQSSAYITMKGSPC
jgi:hypothetical protein